jgi:DNA ligase (NAD+)
LLKKQKRALELREEINKHNINYYTHDNPIISDSEFDLLLQELIKFTI